MDSNNLIAVNQDQNIFDSKKRIKAATVESQKTKPNNSKRSAIARNNALLVTAEMSTLGTKDKDSLLLTKAGKHK